MTDEAPKRRVRMGFETQGVRLPIAEIMPLRLISKAAKRTAKYAQIAASIREIGLVEPPVVARGAGAAGGFILLDGHMRVEILREMGETEVDCLVSTDDEAFTYNRRVNRLAIVQEHRMILRAIERGVPEARIASALNVNVADIRRKRGLLKGICEEAVEILKDRHVPLNTFTELRKLKPMRQIEAAELMAAMNSFSVNYAKSLVAATPDDQLVQPEKRRTARGLTDDQIALMEYESAGLGRAMKLAAETYAPDHFELVLAKGYLAKLLGNERVADYLARNHPDLLPELRKIAELEHTLP